MLSGRVLACGLLIGSALSLPLWLLLNACVLSVTLGVPLKEGPVVGPAALAAIGLALAVGPVAAWRTRATTPRDGVCVGLGAGLAAATPVLLLVVPGAAALALGALPLVEAGASSTAPLMELAWPIAVRAMWSGPLFALTPLLWLALLGGLSGGAFGLVVSVRRVGARRASAPAIAPAS